MNIGEFIEEQKKEKEAEEQRQQDELKKPQDLNSMTTAKQIDEFVRQGGDIQQFEWKRCSFSQHINNAQHGKLIRAVIYNGYDFSDHPEVLVSMGVFSEALSCLEHKGNFKIDGAFDRLKTHCEQLRPYVKGKVSARYDDSQYFIKENQKRQQEEKELRKETENKIPQETAAVEAEENANSQECSLARVRYKLAQKADSKLGTHLAKAKLPEPLKKVETELNEIIIKQKERIL